MDLMFDEDVDEVGSDIEAYCPKCRADTTHVVITKYEDEIRRVQCNPCGDVHSYRKPRGELDEEPPEPLAVRRRQAMKKPTWEEFFADAQPPPLAYSFRETYSEGDVVDHPKFGVGFVSEILSDDKLELTFRDERRILVHNRNDLPEAQLIKAKRKGAAAQVPVPRGAALAAPLRPGQRPAPAGKGAAAKGALAKGLAAKVPAAKVPAGKMPAGKVPAVKVPAATVPAAKVPAAKVPAAKVPAAKAAPAPAPAKPAGRAPAPKAAPAKPAVKAPPTAAARPAKPTKSQRPVAPAQPKKPATPVRAAAPQKPKKPAKPAKPAKPKKPAKPAKPAARKAVKPATKPARKGR